MGPCLYVEPITCPRILKFRSATRVMESQEIRMSERLKSKIKREIELMTEAAIRAVDIRPTAPSDDKVCSLLRCRLCAIPNNSMIDLFSSNSTEQNLVEKIEHCLCIMVKESDALPKKVCSSCLEKLELCYNFNETVAEAEKQLLALHEQTSGQIEETEKNRQSSPLSSVHRDEDESSTIAQEAQVTCATVENNPIPASLELRSVVLVPTQVCYGTESRNNLDTDSRENSIDNEHQSVGSESLEGKKKTEEHPNVDSSMDILNSGELSPSPISRQSICESKVPRVTRLRTEAEESKIPTSHCARRVGDVRMKQENLAVPGRTRTKKTRSFMVRSARSKLNELHKFEHYRKKLISGKEENDDEFSLCDDSFESLKERNEHLPIDTVERKWQCDNCKTKFERKYQLQIHSNYCARLSCTSKQSYRCEICAKTFTMRRSLVDHMKFHTGDQLYKCKYCARKFTRTSNRNRHELIHQEVRPYKCSLCEKSFNVPSKLRCHEVVHSDERNYPCFVCNKSFKLKSVLKVHIAVHTGERPWECDYCKKSFTRKTSIRNHVQICKERD